MISQNRFADKRAISYLPTRAALPATANAAGRAGPTAGARRHEFQHRTAFPWLLSLVACATLLLSLGACVAPVQAVSPGPVPSAVGPPLIPVRHMPAPNPLDLRTWSVSRTGQGTVQLQPAPHRPSEWRFWIAGDTPSTASVSSPPFQLALPYRVTFWVRVSRQNYNGFTIYDAVDAAGNKTDIWVYLHDDRGDRSAAGGWNGALWVGDGTNVYSVTSVPRGQRVKFAIERHRRGQVTLYMNDRPVGSFRSRSARPLDRIVRVGDSNTQWWHGQAAWGPVEVSPAPVQARPPFRPGPPPGHGPAVHPLDLRTWMVSSTRQGTVQLQPAPHRPSAWRFRIASDTPSTASVSSPPLQLGLPYRVTFWVRVSRQKYNGFTIYDAVDAAGNKTDIWVYLHDDRGDRSAAGGWHGALWVGDGTKVYSMTSVPRGQRVKFAVERHGRGQVTLYMNDRQVGSFRSRSARPLDRIVRVGDRNTQWWHGRAAWGPVEIF